jgi:hypothetical protein
MSDATKPRPYVAIASLCERALIERDNVLSLIRVVDTFTPEKPPVETAGVKIIPAAQFYVVVAFKALRLVGPSGKQQPLGDPVTFVLDGNESGFSFVAQVTIPANEPGLSWIDVVVDDEVLTRIPFRIRLQSEDESPSSPQSKSYESETGSVAPESRE